MPVRARVAIRPGGTGSSNPDGAAAEARGQGGEGPHLARGQDHGRHAQRADDHPDPEARGDEADLGGAEADRLRPDGQERALQGVAGLQGAVAEQERGRDGAAPGPDARRGDGRSDQGGRSHGHGGAALGGQGGSSGIVGRAGGATGRWRRGRRGRSPARPSRR